MTIENLYTELAHSLRKRPKLARELLRRLPVERIPVSKTTVLKLCRLHLR